MDNPGGIGILAYGSLMNDPGTEIVPTIARRIPTTTPFPVEYARHSGKRGGAPTVVPHASGNPVKGEVLLLSEAISVEEAKNMLWRRETRNERSGRTYRESALPNAVVIRDQRGFCGLDHVLYTDFNPGGKLENPDPVALANAAIGSVTKAPPGEDGVSYLMDLLDQGVVTALTPQYIERILSLTGATTLAGARDSIQCGPPGVTRNAKR